MKKLTMAGGKLFAGNTASKFEPAGAIRVHPSGPKLGLRVAVIATWFLTSGCGSKPTWTEPADFVRYWG